MNQTEARQTAEKIFQQMGGTRKLTFMVGAKENPIETDETLESTAVLE